MKTVDQLTINLIFLDDSGERWRFDELLQYNGGVALYCQSLDEFADALGGLELISDGHCIFYTSTDLHDLESAVAFLLSSLASLGGLPEAFSDRYDAYSEGPNLAVLHHVSEARLILRKDSRQEDLLNLSFVPPAEYQAKGRNSFFFKPISCTAISWIEQASLALDEYFQVLELVQQNLSSHQNTLHHKLVMKDTWIDHRNTKESPAH